MPNGREFVWQVCSSSPVVFHMTSIINDNIGTCYAEASNTLYERDSFCCQFGMLWLVPEDFRSQNENYILGEDRRSQYTHPDPADQPGISVLRWIKDVTQTIKDDGFLLTIIIERTYVKRKESENLRNWDENLQWLISSPIILWDVLFCQGYEVYWKSCTPATHRRLPACCWLLLHIVLM